MLDLYNKSETKERNIQEGIYEIHELEGLLF